MSKKKLCTPKHLHCDCFLDKFDECCNCNEKYPVPVFHYFKQLAKGIPPYYTQFYCTLCGKQLYRVVESGFFAGGSWLCKKSKKHPNIVFEESHPFGLSLFNIPKNAVFINRDKVK